ncbi:transposase [Saccharopolyspora sp. 5N708]|uniref:transposase n=1 Tax=Saccharopolyspora sp. 5N708 TaxID=3457424 RepID=UPI003FD065A3
MGDKRRRFDPEFRAGAVRIVAETGKPVAKDWRISAYTLCNWVKAERNKSGTRAGPSMTLSATSWRGCGHSGRNGEKALGQVA